MKLIFGEFYNLYFKTKDYGWRCLPSNSKIRKLKPLEWIDLGYLLIRDKIHLLLRRIGL
jgi:hypothetical protein